MVGRVTDEGVKKIAATGANGAEVLKRFAEGGAGSNAVTQQWAQSLIAAHPELLKVARSDRQINHGHSATRRGSEESRRGSVEYKDKTRDLTDAMGKRDDQLDDIKKKRKS